MFSEDVVFSIAKDVGFYINPCNDTILCDREKLVELAKRVVAEVALDFDVMCVDEYGNVTEGYYEPDEPAKIIRKIKEGLGFVS